MPTSSYMGGAPAARTDAYEGVYDLKLDPRYNRQTQQALSNLSNAVDLEANRRAVAGMGSYESNLAALQAQTGLSDWGTYLQRLRGTGSLGVTDLSGRSLDTQLGSGNIGSFVTAGGRPTESWEHILENQDGTFSIYDSRDFNQKYNAFKNRAEGGTGIDYSRDSDQHTDDWRTAVDRYNAIYGDQAAARAAITPGAGAGISGDWSAGNGVGGMDPGATLRGGAGYGVGGGVLGGGNPYARALGGIRAGGQGGSSWSYDPQTDPVYQAYRDQYTRGAQAAMDDTLGQVSARTGGLASSYAAQAAQQGYAQQMQGLNDKIPELYSDAYNRYLSERAYQDQQEEKAYQRALQAEQTAYERRLATAQQAQKDQAEARSQLLSAIKSYGYKPSDAELRAAGIGSELADAILGRGSYAKATGGSGGYGRILQQSIGSTDQNQSAKANPDTRPYGYSDLNTASGDEMSAYLMSLQSASGKTDQIEELRRAGRISERQAAQLLAALGLL